ncbi:MAG: ABC transporter substrate-binding protein [Firmicutes bacterium]|nr:ABC transporter substrate-binding protein [Bacillota bacterium]
MSKRFAGVLLVVFALIFSATSLVLAADDDTLTVAIVRDPDTLDIQRTTWVDAANDVLYDSLVRQGPDGKLYPGLATSWELSEDGKTWTFKLRKGVKFHNGEPFNAYAVKATFDRMLAPETASPVTYMLGDFIKSIEVVDEYTVQLHYEKPFPSLVNSGATTGFLAIYPPKYLEEKGNDFGQFPIGTGPVKFVEHVRGSHILFERNDDYNWGPAYAENQGPLKFKYLKMRIIPDDSTRVMELERGNVDILYGTPPQDVERLKNEGFKIYKAPENGITYWGFNVKKWPFTDPRVRKALAKAIDRQPMIDFALEGLAEPIYGPLPRNIWSYSEEIENRAKELYGYNPEESRRMLNEAGWKDTNGDGILEKDGKNLEFELWVRNIPDEQRVGQIIQAMVAEVGAKVNLKVVEDAAYREGMANGAQDTILWAYGWFDPEILGNMFKTGFSNRTWYSSPELDALIDAGATEVDREKRKEIYHEIQNHLVDACPWVPLYLKQQVFAVNPKIKGFTMNPFRWEQLELADVEF